jgi:hypothetical protein
VGLVLVRGAAGALPGEGPQMSPEADQVWPLEFLPHNNDLSGKGSMWSDTLRLSAALLERYEQHFLLRSHPERGSG